MILKELSDNQIDAYLKKYKLYKGSYGCLKLPKIETGIYIVNIDRDPNGQGTHWVLVDNLQPKKITYFDSFGQIPNSNTNKFMKSSKKQMYYNTTDYQAIKSQACGYYCIYLAEQLFKGRPFDSIIHDFTKDTHRNESYLDNYFK
jgi:hypothetical protein